MPQVAYDVLYKERHIVMTLTALAATCIHLDEAMEMCAIRHTKMLNTCVAEILEKSPAFTMLVGRLRDALERNINVSRKKYSDSEVRVRTNDRNYGSVKVDGEKKTAYNVMMMYELLKDAEWLGFAHRGAEKLQNVLRQQKESSAESENNGLGAFELDDAKVSEALLDADKRGRLVAALHLCAKLEGVFGKLTEKDYEQHFGGKALSNQWTLAFVIKTMRDLDSTKKKQERGRTKKTATQVTKDAFFKRRTEIWNVKEALLELREVSTPELRTCINQVLSEITSREHMASEKCLAYRQNVWSDEGFMKVEKKVFQQLQDVMRRALSQQLAPDSCERGARKRGRDQLEVTSEERQTLFVQDSHLLDMPEFRSIHFDLWDMIYNESPSMSLSDTSIGGAVYEKFKRMLSRYFEGNRYQDVVDMHFHVDTPRYVPAQAKWFNDKRFYDESNLVKREGDADPDISAVGVDSGDVKPSTEDLIDYETPKSRVWQSYFKNAGDRDFLVALHAVLAAKAAVDLLRSRHTYIASGNQELHSEVEYQQRVNIYVHGVELVITDQARDEKLEDLRFSRLNGGILVYSKRNKNLQCSKKRIGREVLLDAQSYDPNCCWSFSDKGVSRFVTGDSQHGESKLRIIHSIENVTETSFQSMELPRDKRNILVISSSTESPFINSVSQGLRGVNIFYRIGETVLVDMNKFHEALVYFNLTPEEVAMVYAMSGSDCTPATQGVRAEYYFNALVSYKKEIGSLSPRIRGQGIAWDLRMYPEAIWSSFERLVAISYGPRRKLSLSGFQTEDHEDPQSCVRALRRAVSKIPGLGPSDLMPETNDIDLQTRRAFWVLRYWRLAEGMSSDGEATRGQCMEWGYQADGKSLLEKPGDVELRRKMLKHILTKCKCKSGCSDRRCSCQKHDPPLLFLLCACSNCKNKGGEQKDTSEEKKDADKQKMIARALASALEANEDDYDVQAGDGDESSSDESSGYVSEDALEHLNEEHNILLQADCDNQQDDMI